MVGRTVDGPEVRYMVYVDHGGEPWVCRLQAGNSSPGGRKRTWVALDGAGPYEERRDSKYPPAATPLEAIRDFQRGECAAFWELNDDKIDARVRLIVAAERLKSQYA